jgi:predicted  nucleic acid-binding Zn-ribbon protein
VTDTHKEIFQHPEYRRLLKEKVKLWYQKLDLEIELSTTKEELEKLRDHHKELQDISLSVGATLLEISSKYEAVSKAVPHHRFTFLN